jgi:hypothetical protein
VHLLDLLLQAELVLLAVLLDGQPGRLLGVVDRVGPAEDLRLEERLELVSAPRRLRRTRDGKECGIWTPDAQ